MRLNKLCLSSMCVISLCVEAISQSHGAGMLADMTAHSMLRTRCVKCIKTCGSLNVGMQTPL